MEETRVVSLLCNVSKVDTEMEQVKKKVEEAQKALQELQNHLQAMELPFGEMNLDVYLAWLEANPELITPGMIKYFAKHGVDLTELSPVAKKKVPDCLKIRNPFDDIAKSGKQVRHKKETSKKNESVKDSNAKDRDFRYRGLVFVKCKPYRELENQMVDELVKVANDRDFYIQQYIVNQNEPGTLLKQWVVSDSIDYVIMHSMSEYSVNPEEQSDLFHLAADHGVSFLIGTMNYEDVCPSMDWFQPEC